MRATKAPVPVIAPDTVTLADADSRPDPVTDGETRGDGATPGNRTALKRLQAADMDITRRASRRSFVADPQTARLDQRELAAVHEAGHAVMRWLRDLPLTALTINDDGTGMCAGTARRVNAADLICVKLAGEAAESGCGIAKLSGVAAAFGIAPLDLSAITTPDFDSARAVLSECLHVRAYRDGVLLDVEASLESWFDCVCEQLFSHEELITQIAVRLFDKGALSARVVAALCREHGKRRYGGAKIS